MASKRILVVEDDEDIRRNLQDILEFQGYEVEQATDGSAALELLKQATQPPSLILLDLMMPGMDGFQFREAQQRDHKIASIPVIVMTADGHIEIKKMKVGAQDSIRKPVELDELLEKVARFCEQ
jgi:CheY-like chemotaxis protein